MSSSPSSMELDRRQPPGAATVIANTSWTKTAGVDDEPSACDTGLTSRGDAGHGFRSPEARHEADDDAVLHWHVVFDDDGPGARTCRTPKQVSGYAFRFVRWRERASFARRFDPRGNPARAPAAAFHLKANRWRRGRARPSSFVGRLSTPPSRQ